MPSAQATAARTTASWGDHDGRAAVDKARAKLVERACEPGLQVGQGLSPFHLQGARHRPPSLPMLRPPLGDLDGEIACHTSP
jgi:hypothetical protein